MPVYAHVGWNRGIKIKTPVCKPKPLCCLTAPCCLIESNDYGHITFTFIILYRHKLNDLPSATNILVKKNGCYKNWRHLLKEAKLLFPE